METILNFAKISRAQLSHLTQKTFVFGTTKNGSRQNIIPSR